jgi:hypothetical protein
LLTDAERKGYSMHSFRIYLATCLMAAGESHAVIQYICRWKSPESCKIYGRRTPEQMGKSIRGAHQQQVTSMQSGTLMKDGPQVDAHDFWQEFAQSKEQTPAQVQKDMWQHAPLNPSDSEDADEEVETPARRATPQDMLGMIIDKQFHAGIFRGTVSDYMPELEVFAVLYTDGDSEDMDLTTLLQHNPRHPPGRQGTPAAEGDEQTLLPHPNDLFHPTQRKKYHGVRRSTRLPGSASRRQDPHACVMTHTEEQTMQLSLSAAMSRVI